ncbi:hypothetical protein [Trebonia sp.]|uniref:hypothetical protein n=1 Tax=Trebonia sp. TaxID=2767075 RepID=UPI003BB10D1D
MAVAGAVLFVLAVLGAVLFPAFPYLRPVLVNVQTALQFLGAALLLGSRMTSRSCSRSDSSSCCKA